MPERFIYYASRGIATAGAAWIGFAAFLAGLNGFGVNVKLPLWLLFVGLWVVATIVGFLGGSWAAKMTSLIAASVLIIGVLFYLVSLAMGKNKGEKLK